MNWPPQKAQRGTVAAPGAIMICAILALVGAGVDMTMVSNQKTNLQKLADNAALSAVREMAIVADDEDRIAAVATAYVLGSERGASIQVSPAVDMQARQVTVNLVASPRTFFPGPMSGVSELSVSATAELSGRGGNVCMIGLSPSAISTLRMRSMARIAAQECAIYSNSTSAMSMSVAATASVEAELICVAGGYQGDTSDMAYKPIEDCPRIQDPLASRPVPPVESCDFNDVRVTTAQTLMPGTYCGGLDVDGGRAMLKSGVYVMVGGLLAVRNNGTLMGEGVGFYLADDSAKLGFDYEANIDITAPESGLMAGLLIMSAPYEKMLSTTDVQLLHRNKLTGRAASYVDTRVDEATRTSDGVKFPDHTIRSDNARRLVGTIYLPNGKLLIDGRNPIADRSEYTVIVADTFELQDGPNLVLRTDYDLTDVPVPEGVGPTKEVAVTLVE